MKYKNLIIIGTSHIAKQSLKEVKKAIEEEKPDIIAIELDRKRLMALASKKKEISDVKIIIDLTEDNIRNGYGDIESIEELKKAGVEVYELKKNFVSFVIKST